MDNCPCNNSESTLLYKEVMRALMRLPAFRYYKGAVDNVQDLYERFPDGCERGSVAFVINEKAFFFWNIENKTWGCMSQSSWENLGLVDNDKLDITTNAGFYLYKMQDSDGTMIGILIVNVLNDGTVAQCRLENGVIIVREKKDGVWTEWHDTAGNENAYTSFMTDTQSLSSASDVPAKGNTILTISTDCTLSISGTSTMAPGYEMLLRIQNIASVDITVTLPVSEEFIHDDGPVISISAGTVAYVWVRCFATGMYITRFKVPSNVFISMTPANIKFDMKGTYISS